MIRLLILLLLTPLAAHAACAPVAMDRPLILRAATEPDPAVHITFLGHASFEIETPRGVRAVTDYSGAFPPERVPDLVTMNHAHGAHFTLSPDPRIRETLHGWQEGSTPPRHDVTLSDLHVRNIPTNIRAWGGATEVNGNSIFVFETGGLCIAHLGHLHHTLDGGDIDALGSIDIVMVMVDGAWSLGQDDARTVVNQIHPRIVLPMHYFTLETLARFLDLMRDGYQVEIRHEPSLIVSRATLPAQPTVIALPGQH